MRNGRATRAVEAAHDALPARGESLAAAAALGARRQRRCSSFKYSPVLPPHRANHARRGPRFLVVRLRSRNTLAAANFGETSPKPWRRRVAPCRRGASPVSVRRQTLTTGCYAAKRFSRQDLLSTRPAQGFANPWIMWQRDCSSDGVFNITMATRDQLGDRRAYVRFNSAGQFWASLDRVEQVVVRNLSVSGVLVEVPAGLKSMQIAQIALQDDGPVIDAVARHASPASDEPREDRFLVGLEFFNLSEDEQANVARMVIDWNATPR